MSDVVFDTMVVALANKEIAARKPGNSFDQRLRLLEIAVAGQVRVRYNGKLLSEYSDKVRERQNDVIDLFFRVLDSPTACRVKKSTLSRQDYHLAVERHRWPTHDQHLLAAARDGNRPHLYVTETRHANCAEGIYRVLRIRVILV